MSTHIPYERRGADAPDFMLPRLDVRYPERGVRKAWLFHFESIAGCSPVTAAGEICIRVLPCINALLWHTTVLLTESYDKTMAATTLANGVETLEVVNPACAEILTPEAMKFLGELHRRFEPTRVERLAARVKVQARIDAGARPDVPPANADARAKEWTVAPVPKDLEDRRVEITGPVERKMVINALNSGANVFLADFEDSNLPKWQNNVDGQINLRDVIARTVTFTSPEGKKYALAEKKATLLVRPRGWHLIERRCLVDGKPMSGSLFDFGLFFFHNAKRLMAKGTGPYFYLPKMEHYPEVRLWNDPNDGADRNHPRGVPDRRNSLGAARSFVRFELRPLGLHFQLHQGVRHAAEFHNAEPRAGHDGPVLPQFLCTAADQDLSPPQHSRDGRHGDADSHQERSRGQRSGAGEGASGLGGLSATDFAVPRVRSSHSMRPHRPENSPTRARQDTDCTPRHYREA